jgi:photosystem II stability/assembly factor-like uncharacterized protein
VGRLPANAGARTTVSDPQHPERVYAAGETGVYRSDDGGQMWQATSEGIENSPINALALDPREPRRLYAGAADGTLYLSDDGASSWRLLVGSAAIAAR